MTALVELTRVHVWLTMAFIGGVYLVLFGVAEILRARARVPAWVTRKLVHVAGGLTALSLPFLFASLWPVIGLAAAFVGLLVATARLGGLASIHAVPGRTVGAYLFPVAIAATFVMAQGNTAAYAAAVLALALGDAAAGAVGQRYGRQRFRVWGACRTVEGSLAAFSVTLATTLAVLMLAGLGPMGSAVIALHVALVVSLVEAASPVGSDNLSVPLAALAALSAAGSPALPAVVLASTAAVVSGVLASRLAAVPPAMQVGALAPVERRSGA